MLKRPLLDSVSCDSSAVWWERDRRQREKVRERFQYYLQLQCLSLIHPWNSLPQFFQALNSPFCFANLIFYFCLLQPESWVMTGSKRKTVIEKFLAICSIEAQRSLWPSCVIICSLSANKMQSSKILQGIWAPSKWYVTYLQWGRRVDEYV